LTQPLRYFVFSQVQWQQVLATPRKAIYHLVQMKDRLGMLLLCFDRFQSYAYQWFDWVEEYWYEDQ
jgi:hypothetical protein